MVSAVPLLEYLEEHEPLTTPLVAPLHGSADTADVRGELLRSQDGTAGGAVVLERTTGSRVTAYAFMTDDRLSEPLARLIDASGARVFQAPASTMSALAPRLTRLATDPVHLWLYGVEYQPDLAARIEPTCRDTGLEVSGMEGVGFAGAGDIEELVDLFTGYEDRAPATAAELREWVTRCALSGWVVTARRDERIVGALTARWCSARYRRLDDLTVLPEYRGQGIGLEISIWTLRQAAAAGTGICGIRALTNGQRITHEQAASAEDMVGTHVWATAPLRAPGRAAGRVRRRVDRLLGKALLPARPARVPKNWQGPGRERATTTTTGSRVG